MAPSWPLTSSHLNTASFYCLRDLSSFSLLSTLFLCLRFVYFFFFSYFFVSSVVSSFFCYLLQVWFVRTRFSSFEHIFPTFSLILILLFFVLFSGVELTNLPTARKSPTRKLLRNERQSALNTKQAEARSQL